MPMFIFVNPRIHFFFVFLTHMMQPIFFMEELFFTFTAF